MLRACLIALLVACLTGCFVATVPEGEPVYEPPAVVEEPPASVFVWAPWPHYEVEHHYVVENEHIYRVHHHYYPFYDRVHPPCRREHGEHRGWFKHHHHDDD